jgi:hypothetical protein
MPTKIPTLNVCPHIITSLLSQEPANYLIFLLYMFRGIRHYHHFHYLNDLPTLTSSANHHRLTNFQFL